MWLSPHKKKRFNKWRRDELGHIICGEVNFTNAQHLNGSCGAIHLYLTCVRWENILQSHLNARNLTKTQRLLKIIINRKPSHHSVCLFRCWLCILSKWQQGFKCTIINFSARSENLACAVRLTKRQTNNVDSSRYLNSPFEKPLNKIGRWTTDIWFLADEN